MTCEYRVPDWDTYRIDSRRPFLEVEPLSAEQAAVDGGLAALVEAGILPHADYDGDKLLAHRRFVAEQFEIPWTAITPRMQRLIWAINAIVQPKQMLAAGVFCGNTFISNAGAAVGPGQVYEAEKLIGVEIKPDEAERAERNVRRIDDSGTARIVAADAIDVARDWPGPMHLLYLDADGTPAQGKGVYLDILSAARDKLTPGAVILAHNSVNCAPRLVHYLAHVRDEKNMRASMNMIIDGEGLEVSCL
jgi:predicted O-methyltransferase YrrM